MLPARSRGVYNDDTSSPMPALALLAISMILAIANSHAARHDARTQRRRIFRACQRKTTRRIFCCHYDDAILTGERRLLRAPFIIAPMSARHYFRLRRLAETTKAEPSCAPYVQAFYI